MADVNIGEIRARLTADASQFIRDIQAATQALTAFQQQVQQQAGRVTQGMQQAAQGSEALRQQLVLLSQQAISQTGFLGQMTRQLDELRGALERTRQTSQQVGSTWQTVFAVAGGVGLATSIQGIVRSVTNLLTESSTLAAKMQDLNLAFRAIDGSSTAANQTIGFLFQTAQRLGIEFTSLADSFKRLDQAARGTSLEGQGIRQVFENVAAGGRALGISSQQSSQALVALEQILTKGRLSAEEYRRQLGNAVPGALQLMASGLQVSTQRMEEFIRLGIVPAETAIIAFGNSMQQLGEQGGQGTIERLSSTFAQLKNETTAWMTAIGEGIASKLKPFLDLIVNISQELRNLFNIQPPGVQTGQAPLPMAPSNYTALIQQEARRSAIDPGLLSQVIRTESGFNPNARSSAGALGLGQLMLTTAQGLEMGVTAENLLEPERNLRLAAKYLADMLDKFRGFNDQVKLALAAYNAGPGAVEALLQGQRREGLPATFEAIQARLPGETQRYVASVLGGGGGTAGAGGAGAQAGVFGAPLGPGVQGPPAPGGMDPFAPMVRDAMQVTNTLRDIQQRMDAIAGSGLNVGGILNKAMNQQADEAVKKFSQIATMLASFPDIMQRMTPEQQKQVQLAAQEVVLIEKRLQDEAQIPAEARRRVQELAGIEREDEARRERDAREMELEQRARMRERAQDLDIFGVLLSPEQEAELKAQVQEQHKRMQDFAKSLDIFGLDLSPEVERQRRASQAFDAQLRSTLDQLQAPREDRPELRLRARAAREGFTLSEEQESMLKRITQVRQEQEQLNEVLRVYEQFAGSIGNAWANALGSIADGTKTVAQAFRDMARSILQSLAQIASQEAFRALIKVGAGLITSALGGGQVGFGEGSGFDVGLRNTTPLVSMQHGGLVTRPTMALIGEAGPELVLGRAQTQALMSSAIRAAPSAGGQAAGSVTVINVASREQAEQTAAQQRAMGRTAVINYVMEDLATGEASRINRLLRTTQR